MWVKRIFVRVRLAGVWFPAQEKRGGYKEPPLTLPDTGSAGAKVLAFGVLELSPCSFLSVLFTFFHSRIACQQAQFFEGVT